MSVTSGDPARLDAYVLGSARLRTGLGSAAAGAQGAYQAFLSSGSAYQGSLGGLAALGCLLQELAGTETFLAGVSQALAAADRSGGAGVVTVADATLAASLPPGVSPGGPGATGHLVVEASTLLGVPPTSGFSDDPVHALTGNFFHPELDLAFPGRSGVLDLARAYNSLAAGRAGAFGPGWTSVADVALVAGPGGGARVLLADGAEVHFAADGSGGFTHLGRPGPSLSRGDHGTWHLTTGPKAGLEFAADGLLSVVRQGRAVARITRDLEGRVARLEEAASGRWVSLVWSGDRVTSAQASDGRRVDYAYEDGSLVAAERPAGAVAYRLAGGRIAAVVDADGVVVVANTYDEEGRVATQTSSFGRVSSYRYEAHGITVVAGADGSGHNVFVHDPRGNLTALADASGAVQRMAYDARGRMTRLVDRRGSAWTLTWNEPGIRPLRREGPLGFVETWEWDAEDRIVAHADPAGATRFAYPGPGYGTPSRIVEPGGESRVEVSEDDLPVRVTDADGVSVTLAYDADGQVRSITDALGNTTTLGYDEAGYLAAWRTPSSATVAFVNDAAGRVLSAASPAGRSTYRWSPGGRGVGGVDAADGAWSAGFGDSGAAAWVNGAAGQRLELAWDDCGNLSGLTGPDGRRCAQLFDGLGQLAGVTDAGGATWRYRRDPEGALVGIEDPTGAQTCREVDSLGRTVGEVDGAGRRWTTGWGDDGRRSQTVDPLGRATTFGYDAAGRLVRVSEDGAAALEAVWSPAGRLLERRGPDGSRTAFSNDAAGRLVGLSDSSGAVSFVLDADGRVVGASDDRGRAVHLERDEAGRVVAVTDGRGVTRRVDLDGGGRVVRSGIGSSAATFGYDAAGMLASAVDPLGAVTSFARDAAGRVVSVTDPLGGTTRYGYDEAGRLGSVVDPAGGLSQILRDGDGRVAGAAFGDGSGWELERDAAGLVTQVRAIGSPGEGVAVDRDAAGRVRGLPAGGSGPGHARAPADLPVDGAGRVSASPRGDLYRHDAGGQLVEWVPPGPPGGAWGWSYDAGGRLVSERSPAGRTSYTHDAAGRLVTRETPAGVTTFSYDAAGRRTFQEGPEESVSYRWDAAGRLVAVVTGSETVGITYDAAGLVSAVGDAEVAWELVDGWPMPSRIGGTAYRRDAGGLWAEEPSGDAELVPCDWMGNAGQLTDPWGVSPKEGVRVGYRGELCVGGLVWLGARVYDPATRSFLSPDPLEPVPGAPCAANPYHYAWNDPVSLVDPTGLRPLTQAEFEARKKVIEEGGFGQAWEAAKKDPWGDLMLGAEVVAGVGLCLIPGTQAIGAGVLIGVGMSAATGIATGTFNPRMAALNGLIGGVTGGVGGAFSGASALVQAGAGAALGATGSAGAQYAASGHVDWGQVAISAGVGGVAAGLGARIGQARTSNLNDPSVDSTTSVTRIYSARVLNRMAEEPGPYHNFPFSFDGQIFREGSQITNPNYFAQPKPWLSNDSVQYALSGTVNGTAGQYEIFTRPSVSGRTEVVMHRFFRPTL